MSETVQIRELEIKVAGRPVTAPAAVTGPEAVVETVREIVGDELREHFVAIYLDGRHRPIGWRVVSIGTQTASLVHPRETFQAAVMLGACALVVAHNHPSGDSSPSREDADVTQRLAEAGDVLGIQLLDALVVAADGFYSFRESRPELF